MKIKIYWKLNKLIIVFTFFLVKNVSVIFSCRLTRSERSLTTLVLVGNHVFLGILVYIKRFDPSVMCSKTAISVSYTHLDVYKRQVYAGFVKILSASSVTTETIT